MNLQENINRIKEMMELTPNERVYDYQEGRDTVPNKLPFDIDKLVDSGVVFVTPGIDGDPNSKTYKEWSKEPSFHLITLYNMGRLGILWSSPYSDNLIKIPVSLRNALVFN